MSGFGLGAHFRSRPVADAATGGQDGRMVYTLLFEIWEDPDRHSFEWSAVSEQGDELRKKVFPNSVLRHTFRAKSDVEAGQMNYDWHGWGAYDPGPFPERFVTSEDVAVQERYLAVRNLG